MAGPAQARDGKPFRNPRLPLTQRVDDLLHRLTLDEKISRLHQLPGRGSAAGVKPFKTGTEALHGIAWSTDRGNGGAVVTAKGTVFPQAVGLGATWDPFGYGLSYTSFGYGKPKLSAGSVAGIGTVTVSVDVTNTGRVAGDEVVQLYTHQRTSRDMLPIKQLRAFQRVHLAPGQHKTVRLKLRAADLAHWDVTRDRWVVESADHDILVGASSADIRQQATLKVPGETIPARNLTGQTRAADFDDQQGIELVDETKVRGDAVGARSGDWIAFADADLRSGLDGFRARVARAGAGDTTIQIRLDGPNGPLAGTVTVPSTGDEYTYQDVTAAVTGVAGRHDVYLVFGGDLRLSTFAFTK